MLNLKYNHINSLDCWYLVKHFGIQKIQKLKIYLCVMFYRFIIHRTRVLSHHQLYLMIINLWNITPRNILHFLEEITVFLFLSLLLHPWASNSLSMKKWWFVRSVSETFEFFLMTFKTKGVYIIFTLNTVSFWLNERQ